MANEQNTSKPSNDVVWVGCKLPHGLWLEIIDVQPNPAPGLPPNMNPRPAGPRVRLNGANSVQHEGQIVRVTPRIHEYGRTAVPREFWERWLKANKDMAFIKNGQVFAEDNSRDFAAHAKEALPEKTGLEGLNPLGGDERMKKIQIPGQPETKIETDQEHLEKLRRAIPNAA